MRVVSTRIGSRWILVLSAALLMTAAARAQEPGPDSAPPPGHGPMHGPGFGGVPFGERMELLGIGGMHDGKVVTGAPFSAVATASTRQTLSDGTVITRTVQSNLFRDAQGRSRRETTMPAIGPLAANGAPKTFVMIQDPVAKANYMLDPGKKIAHQVLQRNHGDAAAADTEGTPPRKPGDNATAVKESLGTQTINGISVQGTRFTRTIPAGQIGNDKPLSIVREEWYSPELQMVIQSKHSDPFMGETTYTVANIQRTAPDASLFSVPSDYTVKTGPGPRGMRRGHRAGGAPPPPAPDAPGPGR